MAEQPPPTVLAFLREVVADVVLQGRSPAIRDLELRYADEPWFMQEILQSGWFGVVSGFLVPSIRGLRAAETPEASQRIEDAKRVFETVRRLYREGKINVGDHPLVAQELAVPSELVTSVLGHLVASSGFFGSWNSGDAAAPARHASVTDRIFSEDPFVDTEPPPPALERGPISLRLRDFRGLREVDWCPEGVCLIAGPNGSGKTTLLEALLFLSDAFGSNLSTAVRRQRGPAALRHLRSADADRVMFRLQVGEVSWELYLDVSGGVVGELPEETVSSGATTRVRRTAYSARWYLGRETRGPDSQGRLCLRMAWDVRPSSDLKPLVDVLQSYRHHAGYALDLLRQGGKGGEDDAFLTPKGENLFVVLRNWKAAPRRFDDRFNWVLERIKRAFPGVVEDIEFDPPVGEIVPARFYPPGERTGLPMSRAADGFLVGLLHLTAVAGAAEGAIVAIDEMENQLHPHAIRSILAAMRELAEEKSLTVILTTHSPVLMNAFRDEPHRFYVTELSDRVQPIALDKLQDPEWLAHFSLGDLYDRLEIGAPPRAAK